MQGESYEIYYGIIYPPKLLYPFRHNTCIRGKCHLDDTYFFAEQAPEQSKKRRRYLGYMLVSFLFFLPYFGGGVYFSFYCIPFFTIPAFVISAILMIRTYFVEQTPEESRKRRGYLGCMLVSFLLFLLFFGGVILMLSCVID